VPCTASVAGMRISIELFIRRTPISLFARRVVGGSNSCPLWLLLTLSAGIPSAAKCQAAIIATESEENAKKDSAGRRCELVPAENPKSGKKSGDLTRRPVCRGNVRTHLDRVLVAGLADSQPRRIGTRAYRAASSGGGLQSSTCRPSAVVLGRSAGLGVALPGVAALPRNDGAGEARHRGPVAPPGLSALLALAVAVRAKTDIWPNSQTNPRDVLR